MNAEKLNEQIIERLAILETPELVTIWTENNRALWSARAFAAVEVILNERGIDLPPQQEPQHRVVHSDVPLLYNKNWALIIGRWAMLGAFLVWILLLAPASEVGVIETPLNITFQQLWKYYDGNQEIQTFQMLVMVMIDIKFLIGCFGIVTGILLLMGRAKGVTLAKMYLLFVAMWVGMFLCLINVSPFAEIYWHNFGSVMDIETDWESILTGYTIKPGWDLLAYSTKQFWPVLGCALIWFLFFQRSTWIKERFSVGSCGANSD